MTRAEIVSRLRFYRYSGWALGRGFTLTNISRLCHLPKWHVAYARDYGYFDSPSDENRIRAALQQIDRGEVAFAPPPTDTKQLRRGNGWSIVILTVPRNRPQQNRLTEAANHQRWALCATCGKGLWERIVIRRTGYYACLQCCGPAHWKAMGAHAAVMQLNRLPLGKRHLSEKWLFPDDPVQEGGFVYDSEDMAMSQPPLRKGL